MSLLGRRLTLQYPGGRTVQRHYNLTSGYNRPSWAWARIPLSLSLYIPSILPSRRLSYLYYLQLPFPVIFIHKNTKTNLTVGVITPDHPPAYLLTFFLRCRSKHYINFTGYKFGPSTIVNILQLKNISELLRD